MQSVSDHKVEGGKAWKRRYCLVRILEQDVVDIIPQLHVNSDWWSQRCGKFHLTSRCHQLHKPPWNPSGSLLLSVFDSCNHLSLECSINDSVCDRYHTSSGLLRAGNGVRIDSLCEYLLVKLLSTSGNV